MIQLLIGVRRDGFQRDRESHPIQDRPVQHHVIVAVAQRGPERHNLMEQVAGSPYLLDDDAVIEVGRVEHLGPDPFIECADVLDRIVGRR